jgi:mannose-1-phosphate guanylyltransferase
VFDMTPSISHGIVLCAGLGLRLRPLTDGRPKPLLRFLDRPIARYSVDALTRAGIWSIGLNAHHHADQIAAFAAETEREIRQALPAQPTLRVVREPTLLGTGAGARNVWMAMGAPSSTVAILNGDLVADIPLDAMIKTHRRTGALATLLVIPAVPGETPVFLDPSRTWLAQSPSAGGEARSPLHPIGGAATFGGVYLVEPAVLERMPAHGGCLIRHGIAPLLEGGARIAVVEHEGFWADLGTPARFFRATCELLEDPLRLSQGPLPVRADRIYVADTRKVHPHARLEAPCYVAPGAIVEAGATIGPRTVVGAGAVVRSHARLSDTILMGNTQLSGVIHRRIVCDGYTVRLP